MGVRDPLWAQSSNGEMNMGNYKRWSFMDLKRELLVDDRRDRPSRQRARKKFTQSKGWKARHTKMVDWGPYDGAKVLEKLREVA